MKVLVLPRDANPYQGHLYSALAPRGVQARYLGDRTPSQSLNVLLLPLEVIAGRVWGARLLHLHWVFGFRLAGAGRVPGIRRLMQWWFRLTLAVARRCGVRLVWTAHNALPHDRVFHDDLSMRRRLVAASDCVIAHSEAALDELARLDLTPRRGTVVPHGTVAPVAAPPPDPSPAPDGRRSVLFAGRVASYKGVEDLLTVVRDLPSATPLRVTVLGECRDPHLAERLRRLAGRSMVPVELRLHFAGDEELEQALRECDVVALPYRHSTTSGVASLALAAGRPVVVPDLPAFAATPDACAFRYDGTGGGLRQALLAVASATEEDLRHRRRASWRSAAASSWPQVADRTLQEYRRVLGEPPAPTDATGTSATGPPTGGRGWRGRLGPTVMRFWADDLYRVSIVLLANTGLLAASGFVFWALATHLYTPDIVGGFSALTSGVALVVTVAAIGLPNMLIRHLSRHAAPARLISGSVCVTIAFGGLLSLATVFGLGPVLPHALHLDGSRSSDVYAVVLILMTALSGLIDAALISARAAGAVLFKGIVGSAIRLAGLVLLSGMGATGLLLAYAIGTAVPVLVGVVLVRRRYGSPGRLRTSLPLLRPVVRFTAGNYLGTVVGILPTTVVPFIVLADRGSAPTAYFTMALMIAALLNLIPSTTSQAFFAQSSAEPDRMLWHAQRTLRGIYVLLVPSVLLFVAAAPLVLRVLGSAYAVHGTTTLRLLALASLITAINYIVDNMFNAAGKPAAYALVNVLNAVLVLAAVAAFAGRGDSGAALGWCIGQAVSMLVGVAMLVLTGILRVRPRPVRRRARPRQRWFTPRSVFVPGAAGAGATVPVVTESGVARLAFLDGIRGWAALYVVVSHAYDTVFPGAAAHPTGLSTATAFLGFGRLAVAVFIVVSGVSLGLVAWRNGLAWPGGAWAFVRRRVRRIGPPYWAAIAVSAGLGATVLSRPSGSLYDGAIPIRWSGVVDHALALQDVHWAGPAGSTAFWSIAVEVHIYVVFLVLLAVWRRWRPAAWATVGLGFALTVIGAASWAPAGRYLPSLYAAFVLGLSVAGRIGRPSESALSRVGTDRTLWVWLALGVAGAGVAAGHEAPNSPLNDLWVAPLAALAVVRLGSGRWAQLGRVLRHRFSVWLGSSSYSLYLIHPVVLELVWRFIVKPVGLPSVGQLLLELTLGCAASLATARLLFFTVERHFLGGRKPAVPDQQPAAPAWITPAAVVAAPVSGGVTAAEQPALR